jgi:hypothetical protein
VATSAIGPMAAERGGAASPQQSGYGSRGANVLACQHLFDIGIHGIRDVAAFPAKTIAMLVKNLLYIQQATLPSPRRCTFPIFCDGRFSQRNAVRVTRSNQTAQSIQARVDTNHHLSSMQLDSPPCHPSWGNFSEMGQFDHTASSEDPVSLGSFAARLQLRRPPRRRPTCPAAPYASSEPSQEPLAGAVGSPLPRLQCLAASNSPRGKCGAHIGQKTVPLAEAPRRASKPSSWMSVPSSISCRAGQKTGGVRACGGARSARISVSKRQFIGDLPCRTSIPSPSSTAACSRRSTQSTRAG